MNNININKNAKRVWVIQNYNFSLKKSQIKSSIEKTNTEKNRKFNLEYRH